jgi:hypothetical protein
MAKDYDGRGKVEFSKEEDDFLALAKRKRWPKTSNYPMSRLLAEYQDSTSMLWVISMLSIITLYYEDFRF